MKLAMWFLRRRFLNFVIYYWLTLIISPWKSVWPFILTNLNPLYRRMLCVKFGWNWLSGSGEEDFLISSMYFRYFVIISPWIRAGPFIWTNWYPLHPRMLCVKFGWNWLSGSGEEDENVKSLRQRRRQRRQQQRRRTTDKFWSEKLTWAFGSGELKKSSEVQFHLSLDLYKNSIIYQYLIAQCVVNI